MRRRQGVALFVVMSVVLVLGAFAAMLWSNRGQAQAPQEQTFEKRQAEFLAKGAQQHALLKCRLLPTELYDAVSYSIGRNPYFDFGLGLQQDLESGGTKLSAVDADRNPGPMFFTGSATVTRQEDPENAGEYLLKIQRSNTEGDSQWTMNGLLTMFTHDIATLFPVATKDEAIVVVDSRAHRDLAMGVDDWRDPFIGNYKVEQLRILGLQGGRRYDRDTMLLTTIGSVKRAGQISLVTNIRGEPKNLSPRRRVVHKIADNTMGEFDTVFEDDASFSDRLGEIGDGSEGNDVFDPDTSGRRTEIATGIYIITRKALDPTS